MEEGRNARRALGYVLYMTRRVFVFFNDADHHGLRTLKYGSKDHRVSVTQPVGLRAPTFSTSTVARQQL
jgi:hypothetical protein